MVLYSPQNVFTSTFPILNNYELSRERNTAMGNAYIYKVWGEEKK